MGTHHRSMVALFAIAIVASFTLPASSQQQLPSFSSCQNQSLDTCNSLVVNIFIDGCNTSQCIQCLIDCNVVTPSPVTTPPAVQCPSFDCISGLCSPYYILEQLVQNASCQDTYSQEYCSYCEICFSSLFPPSSGGGSGSGLGNLCDSSYLILFCRLLPDNANTCVSQFGGQVCNYCQSVTTTCGSLSINNLTSIQISTLCEYHTSLCLVYGGCTHDPFNATICAYCDYTVANDLCPALPNCSSDIGLVCRLLNYDLLDCYTRYYSDTCNECSFNFYLCGSIPRGSFSSSEINLICNSNTATLCPAVLSIPQSNCLSSYSAYNCTYCHATQEICTYVIPSSGSGNLPISCSSNYASGCALNTTFFPCSILYGTTYCSQCQDVVQACQNNRYPNGYIPPLCGNSVFISICTSVDQLQNCFSQLSLYVCTICTATVTNCQPSADLNIGLNTLCSTEAFAVCNVIYYAGSNCSSSLQENDCLFCQVQALLCEGYSGSGMSPGSGFTTPTTPSGNGNLSCSEAFPLFCRLIDPPTCISTYDPTTCQYCLIFIVSCGSLTIDQLTSADINTLCATFNSNCPQLIANAATLCSIPNNTLDCDYCLGTQSYCNNNDTGSGGNQCTTSESLFCRLIASNSTNCYAKYSNSLCSSCANVVEVCGTITLGELSPDDLSGLCTHSSYCASVELSPHLCGTYIENSTCDYCLAINDICTMGNESICNDYNVTYCADFYFYWPCYSLYGYQFCELCKGVVDVCPNLSFRPNFVPDSICQDSGYLSVCTQLLKDNCVDTYGQSLCDYCSLVNSTCPSVAPDIVTMTLSSICNETFGTCTQLLASVPANECNSTYTPSDCAFCTFLSLYCPDNSSSGSGSSDQLPCADEFIFFCNAITITQNCLNSYSTRTCQECQMYLERCIEGSGSPVIGSGAVVDYCGSSYNLLTCGSLPIGPGCYIFLQQDDDLIICDYCSFFSDLCQQQLCQQSSLVQQCYNLISIGSTPDLSYIGNITGETNQCLPCSLIYSLCPRVISSGGGSGNGTGSGAAQGSGRRPIIGSGSGAVIGPGNGTGSGAATGPGSGAGIGSGSGRTGDSGSGGGFGPITGSGNGSDLGSGSVSGAGGGGDGSGIPSSSGSGTGIGSGNGAGIRPGTGSGTSSESGIGSGGDNSVVTSLTSSIQLSTTTSVSSTIIISSTSTRSTTSTTSTPSRTSTTLTPTPTESPTIPVRE